MGQKQRVDQQPGFVLHTHPYRETSLIVEVFSRDYGRMALVAKGARRPMSALRGVLMAYQPLLLDWSGSGEVKTLIRAEWLGGQPLLSGKELLCGYYLNELLVKLLPREDAHAELYAHYAALIQRLPGETRFEPVLRAFELTLLSELGYGVPLEHDAETESPIEADAHYGYIIDRGPVRDVSPEDGLPMVTGQTLLDMAAGRFDDPKTLVQSKALLRHLIQHHLGAQPLHSRRMFKELQAL
ncbi:DNA repair protein RecO [Denitromonas ohlonensis]|uniref:DNA repair protein RecO n=2 Tax=Denitromonas TaxID=139331 RepID=A0A558EA79_9RHOO|nr:DNA repair protein RecO [Denitromonas ohlonensis]TVO65778.1 DNA repair protein RecO [Denitromonas ohlonensis]TVO79371.1 DNA repair protein RecO [Denitromonas ohlonensis]TVT70261.1 MAG: DNA repair protein RecO [Denitromonas halophila]